MILDPLQVNDGIPEARVHPDNGIKVLAPGIILFTDERQEHIV